MQTITWKKCPSVTRPRKFFFAAKVGAETVTVCQSWKTGKWAADGFLAEFDNAKQAMRYVALVESNKTNPALLALRRACTPTPSNPAIVGIPAHS